MAATRIALCFFSALLVFLVLSFESDAKIIRRDAADSKNASQTIDEALQSFKSGLDDLVKNIQSNELFQNVSHSLKSFGEEVQNQGKQLVEKLQNAGKTEGAAAN